ncbi:MAG: SGNH/GDSL hydrolase family protein [Firmicutes bacterium]|nr:SGNH/GDSL hydrolase family protein [Bacillota bacterium]
MALKMKYIGTIIISFMLLVAGVLTASAQTEVNDHFDYKIGKLFWFENGVQKKQDDIALDYITSENNVPTDTSGAANIIEEQGNKMLQMTMPNAAGKVFYLTRGFNILPDVFTIEERIRIDSADVPNNAIFLLRLYGTNTANANYSSNIFKLNGATLSASTSEDAGNSNNASNILKTLNVGEWYTIRATIYWDLFGTDYAKIALLDAHGNNVALNPGAQTEFALHKEFEARSNLAPTSGAGIDNIGEISRVCLAFVSGANIGLTAPNTITIDYFKMSYPETPEAFFADGSKVRYASEVSAGKKVLNIIFPSQMREETLNTNTIILTKRGGDEVPCSGSYCTETRTYTLITDNDLEVDITYDLIITADALKISGTPSDEIYHQRRISFSTETKAFLVKGVHYYYNGNPIDELGDITLLPGTGVDCRVDIQNISGSSKEVTVAAALFNSELGLLTNATLTNENVPSNGLSTVHINLTLPLGVYDNLDKYHIKVFAWEGEDGKKGFESMLPISLEPMGLCYRQNGLPNTRVKIEQDKNLKIGYIGGSITVGAGVDPISQQGNLAWRPLTTKWLQTQYPDCKIMEVNAALAGTTSEYAAFRAAQELTPFKPDLVFVEFSVNDRSTPREQIQRSMEGLVLQVWEVNPKAEIVFVYFLDTVFEADYNAGRTPNTVVYMEEIADHYGILSVNVGKVIYDRYIAEGKGHYNGSGYSSDGTHPNTNGHAIAAETIQIKLTEWLHTYSAPNEKVLGETFTHHPINGRIISALDALAHGDFVLGDIPKDAKVACNYAPLNNPPRWYTPGSIQFDGHHIYFSYTFYGSDIAVLLHTVSQTNASIINWSIDNENYNNNMLSYSGYAMLGRNLPVGEHTLYMRTAPRAGNNGMLIELAGFFVGN